jgi:hypothetical protein
VTEAGQSRTDIALVKKEHIDALTQAGDFCFVAMGHAGRKVVMACPVCAGVFFCPHTVVQEEPLTLSPSVVGPADPLREWNSQVLAPCNHHFWVKDGKAIDVR